MKLIRPLIFFDLETTGLNISTDRIIEISVIKVMPNGEEKCHTRRLNPEMPIPAESTAIHGITDADVANEPKFRQIAVSLASIFEGCDIAGFNSNRFDLPMLKQEFDRVGVPFKLDGVNFIDVQTIYHKREPRNLAAAYRFYCGKEIENAHSADADTRATLEIFKAQLDKYADLPSEIKDLAAYTSFNKNVDLAGRLIFDDNGREVINFGKHKGKLAEEVLAAEPGYLSWIKHADFTDDTKQHFERIYNRVKNSNPTKC